MIGKTLSHYRILEELGRGGMGIVYKAEDTKLGRTVALKLLPTYAAVSEHDKSRFEREARAAAAINHSRIATIYDFGETADGEVYLAMEYIAGETLSEMIEKGPFQIEKAISIAVQVAEGLQVAHEAGVVHRDIKSSNIMLTERGEVKIMDFGLAIMESASKLTQEGTTLGTIAYMSPEQARADKVDLRSDLWSLGVVLYEMIAGRTPFEGAYEQAFIYTILNVDPKPLTGIRTGVPMELERVVNKCLFKDVGIRYQHADDLIADLRAIDVSDLSSSKQTSAATMVTQAASREVRIRIPKFVLPVLLVASLIVVAVIWVMNPGNDIRTMTVTDTKLLTEQDDYVRFPDIRPGGDIVAYTVKKKGDIERIYYQQISGGSPQLLLRNFQGSQLFPKYSPDGQTLLFSSDDDGTLYTVEALGGTPIPRATRQRGEGSSFVNPDWSPDGKQIAFTARVRTTQATGMDSLYVLDLATKKRRVVAVIRGVHSPSWSPDGTRLAVVSENYEYVLNDRNNASSSIWIVPLNGDPKRQVTTDTFMNLSPVWTPDGSGILFTSEREESNNLDIWALRIRSNGEADGEARKVYSTGRRLRSLAYAPEGNFLIAEEVRNRQNIWSSPIREGFVASAADAIPITTGDQLVESVVVSPDQTKIAYDSNIRGGSKLFVQSLVSGDVRQVTSDNAYDYVYSWSPDGLHLAFHSQRNEIRDIFSIRLSDGYVSEVVVDSTTKMHPRWLADGETMGFTRLSVDQGRDLVLVHRLPDGTWGQEETIIQDSLGSAISHPFENRMAFNTYRSRLYITDLDTFESKLILENKRTPEHVPGVWWPVWKPDGSVIFFSDDAGTGGGSVWSVPSSGGTPIEVLRMDGKQLAKAYVSVSDSALYYVMGETETDLWKFDLSTSQ